MYSSIFLSLALAVSALPTAHVRRDHDRGAVYYLSNDAQNNVVALNVARDGTLTDGTTTSTNGAGSNGINPMTGGLVAPDALFSQQALTVAGNKLFAVNAGSNTISMFHIDERDPTKLTLLGSPVSSGGEFPVSIAASKQHKIVCVANSGAKAGVACSKYSHEGLQAADALRPFNLNQTTPPTGPANTVSQIFFSGDESAVLTTVKGVPMTANHGYVSTFPVSHGAVSQTGYQSTPAGFTLPFGAAVVPNSDRYVISDPSIGGGTVSVSSNTGAANVVALDVVAGQKAICWAIYAPSSDTAFFADAGLNLLSEVDVHSGAPLRSYNSTNGNPGNLDMGVKGKYLYALSTGAGAIAVFDIGSGRIADTQNFKPAGFTKNAMGIAVY